MRSRGRTLFLIAASLLAGLFVASWIYDALYVPVDRFGGERQFVVEPGSGMAAVFAQLEAEGLMQDSFWLGLWARLRGWDHRLRAGHYALSPAMAPAEILERLVEGRRLLQRLTLPEGLRAEESLALVEAALELPADSLRAAANDSSWLRSLGLPAPALEGYLFPETYFFDPGVSSRHVIGHLVGQALAYFTPAKRTRARELELTVHEAVTLASIVEAEARLPEERPRISAVFHNRLERDWPLQADPTVLYARGRPGAPLTS
ncbi:MAG: endolytic transglycosylase MltG, partial [Candidatus Eisenbacteria bacterium]|nr:endolytic transglycosylase MltG [Candidatus Eisenbacteria bacterium]